MSVPGHEQKTPPSPFPFRELPEIPRPLESVTDAGLSSNTTELPVLAARDSGTSAALAAKPAAKIELPRRLIKLTTGDITNDTRTQNYLITNHQAQFRQGLSAALSAHTLEKNLHNSEAAKTLLRDNSTDANRALISGGNITREAQHNLQLLASGTADAELTGQARSKAVAHKAGYTHLAIQEFFNAEATPHTAEKLITTLNNIHNLKLTVDEK